MTFSRGRIVIAILILILVWVATWKEEPLSDQGAQTPQERATSAAPAISTDRKTGMTGSSSVTASTKMNNRPPIIKGLQLSPIPAYFGDAIRVEPTAEDPDGDVIQLDYQWQVNGVLIDGNNRETLSAEHVHSADKILVIVTPSDPHSSGESYSSSMLTVFNKTPEIVSVPPPEGREGKYLYQIVANDPDLDKLSYLLLKGPDKMVVDPETGSLIWEMTALPNNQTDIELEVTDNKGGRAIQQFKLKTQVP
ncbi:MAG: hypothetical protein AAB035_02800 [Nitrospirota bacterium]